jgi:hypothetical protein
MHAYTAAAETTRQRQRQRQRTRGGKEKKDADGMHARDAAAVASGVVVASDVAERGRSLMVEGKSISIAACRELCSKVREGGLSVCSAKAGGGLLRRAGEAGGAGHAPGGKGASLPHAVGEGGALSLDSVHGYGGAVGYRSDGVVVFAAAAVGVLQAGCRQIGFFSKHRQTFFFLVWEIFFFILSLPL